MIVYLLIRLVKDLIQLLLIKSQLIQDRDFQKMYKQLKKQRDLIHIIVFTTLLKVT